MKCNLFYLGEGARKRALQADSDFKSLREIVQRTFKIESEKYRLKYSFNESQSIQLNDQKDYQQMLQQMAKQTKILRIYAFKGQTIQTQFKTQKLRQGGQKSVDVSKESSQMKSQKEDISSRNQVEKKQSIDYRPLLRQIINIDLSQVEDKSQPITSDDILKQNDNFIGEINTLKKKLGKILDQNYNTWLEEFYKQSQSVAKTGRR